MLRNQNTCFVFASAKEEIMKKQLVRSTMFIALFATLVRDMISKSRLFKTMNTGSIRS